MKVRVLFKSCDPTELIPAWLIQSKPEWTELPDDEMELSVSQPSVEMALSLLIGLAGGKDWINRHPSVSESIPPDVFHNVGGWAAARAREDRFRFTYQGWHIGLTDLDIQSLLGKSSPSHLTSPPVPMPSCAYDDDLEEEDLGGGFAH